MKLDLKTRSNIPLYTKMDRNGVDLLDDRLTATVMAPPPRFIVWRPMPGAGKDAGFWEARWDLTDGDEYLEICNLPSPQQVADADLAKKVELEFVADKYSDGHVTAGQLRQSAIAYAKAQEKK
jgi:hypothetical protein